MSVLIRSSDLVRADRAAVAVERKVGPHVPRPPLLWPRWVPSGPNTGRTVFEPIDPARIPAHWQAIRVSVASRPASCEEVDCPMFLAGWTEVVMPDGNRFPRLGKVSRDEAAGMFGRYGPQQLAPDVIFHPDGMPCGRPHRTANHDMPPLYNVNGRPVLWNEFEDTVGGGIHSAQQFQREGRS